MESLTLFIIASIALIITPGPENIYVLTRGIADGKRSGAMSAIGVMTGNCHPKLIPWQMNLHHNYFAYELNFVFVRFNSFSIFNNNDGLKLKIFKSYLTAGNRFSEKKT
ncbi:MAG: hypothetical protein PVH37_20355 [Desulfobacterales bacterium]|jgi:hypothetical protein